VVLCLVVVVVFSSSSNRMTQYGFVVALDLPISRPSMISTRRVAIVLNSSFSATTSPRGALWKEKEKEKEKKRRMKEQKGEGQTTKKTNKPAVQNFHSEGGVILLVQ